MLKLSGSAVIIIVFVSTGAKTAEVGEVVDAADIPGLLDSGNPRGRIVDVRRVGQPTSSTLDRAGGSLGTHSSRSSSDFQIPLRLPPGGGGGYRLRDQIMIVPEGAGDLQ